MIFMKWYINDSSSEDDEHEEEEEEESNDDRFSVSSTSESPFI